MSKGQKALAKGCLKFAEIQKAKKAKAAETEPPIFNPALAAAELDAVIAALGKGE